MKWPWRKPKKLNETTRLYALYGESGNLEYLDNQDKDTIKRVEVVENNLQHTNQNLNQTNQSLTQTNNKVNNLENRLDNLPQSDVNKAYVDRQDGLLRGEIAIAQGTANLNEKEIKKTNSALSNLADRVVDLALEHKKFAKKDVVDTQIDRVNGRIDFVIENAINSFVSYENRYMNTVSIDKYENSGTYIWQISRILCDMTWPPQSQIAYGRYLLTFTFLAEFSGLPKTEFKITRAAVHGEDSFELLENYQYVWITTFSGVGTDTNPKIKLKWIEGKRML